MPLIRIVTLGSPASGVRTAARPSTVLDCVILMSARSGTLQQPRTATVTSHVLIDRAPGVRRMGKGPALYWQTLFRAARGSCGVTPIEVFVPRSRMKWASVWPRRLPFSHQPDEPGYRTTISIAPDAGS